MVFTFCFLKYRKNQEILRKTRLTWIIHTALRSPAKQKKTKKNKKKQFNIGFIWFCLVLWGFA